MFASVRVFSRIALSLFASTCAMAAEGGFDASFGTDATAPGFGFYPSPFAPTNLDSGRILVPTRDDKLYLVGYINASGGRIAVQRTDKNGYPDDSFGSFGMRTYVRPCNQSFPSDAKVDGQNRLWLVLEGCSNFDVYRFTASGELDTTLQGDGTVSLSFNRGLHSDWAEEILVQDDGSFVVAGTSFGDMHKDLGVAAFDANGNPDPNFGSGGKVVVTMPYNIYRISGLHRMQDGRLVIDGVLSEDNNQEHFVVRMQASGLLDAGFGITSPGISRYDFRPANRLDGLLFPVRSWLESDGKLVQVGNARYNAFPNSRYDVAITRWRGDGSLDTSVGTAGTRRYPLDLSGNTPTDSADNSESPQSLVREGNGRWLIAYQAQKAGPGSCIGILRLKRDFSPDTSFGAAGHSCASFTLEGSDVGYDMFDVISRPGRAVMAGSGYVGAGGTKILSMAAVESDLLFGDTFD